MKVISAPHRKFLIVTMLLLGALFSMATPAYAATSSVAPHLAKQH